MSRCLPAQAFIHDDPIRRTFYRQCDDLRLAGVQVLSQRVDQWRVSDSCIGDPIGGFNLAGARFSFAGNQNFLTHGFRNEDGRVKMTEQVEAA